MTTKAKTTKDAKANTKTKAKKSTHANRGKEFENLITAKCEQYIKDEIANIYKIPTEFTILRRFDPIKKISIICSAFPKEKSTIDYMGDYNGKSIAIEAKETENKTSFPFVNVKDHQWEFMKQWKGIKFFLIKFKQFDLTFMINADMFINLKETADRKSATLDWFKKNCLVLDDDLDFVKFIDCL